VVSVGLFHGATRKYLVPGPGTDERSYSTRIVAVVEQFYIALSDLCRSRE